MLSYVNTVNMTVKLLTINIWFGGKVWDNLIEFIYAEKPDILLLQEVYNGTDPNLEKRYRTIEEFQKQFGEFLPYYAFGATVLDSAVNVPWGNAVFSKFPIQNHQTIFFDLPFTQYNFTTDTDSRLASEGMIEAEIEIGESNFFIYSWHGVWDNHGGDTFNRKLMTEIIVDSLKDKKNIILAGDTNMDPDTEAMKTISEKLGLISVFGESLKTTFNMSQKVQPGNYANSPVDRIFVRPEIKIIMKEMPLVDVSDHYPLEVILEI